MNGSGLTGTGAGGADTLLSIGGANTRRRSWADNATAERREAGLPVAREGPTPRKRGVARHLRDTYKAVTSLGAPPIPSLGACPPKLQRRWGWAATKVKRGRKTRTPNEPGTKNTALLDMVNRKRRGAMHRQSAGAPSRQRQRTRDSARGARFDAPPAHCVGPAQSLHGRAIVAIAGRVSHARGTAEYRRRDQAVGRAAEEASLTSTRRARAWPSSTSRRRIPRSGTTSSARSG